MTDKEYLKALGDKIKEIRKSKGMTRGQLTERSQLDHSGLDYIQAGRTDCRLLTLRKIAKGLGVGIHELLP